MRRRLSAERSQILEKLRGALALAKAKSQAHLDAHRQVQAANECLAKAQTDMRTAVAAAASAEAEAMASATNVHRLHLALGAQCIGMFKRLML